MSIPHIFLVEDHLPDVLAFRESLARCGIAFTLEHYDDGEKAACAIAGLSTPPDLFVIDLYVPLVSGFDLIQEIRNHETTALVPMAVLTGSGDEGDRARSEQLAADDYIVKPQNLTEFVDRIGGAVRSLLEKAEARYPPPKTEARPKTDSAASE